MPLKRKNNTKKYLIIGVLIILVVLMIVSMPAPDHVTEVVLHQ